MRRSINGTKKAYHKYKGEKIVKKILLWLYKATWIIGILWTIVIVITTLITNQLDCVNNYAPWLIYLLFFAGVILILDIFLLLCFSSTQKNQIKRNEKSNKLPLENIIAAENIDRTDGGEYGKENRDLIVLPLYLIWVFALSKIIIYFAKRGNQAFINDISALMIATAIFLFGFFYWISLKEYANSDNRWSLKYTILITLLSLFSIYWENLLPYIKDIFEVSNCIFKSIK